MARELIRKATLEDMPILLEIYDRARKFMASCGNVNQWTNGYPSKEILSEDIKKGEMYVLEDDGVKAECVVLDVGGGVLEIKNIATDPQFHGKGYGKALIEFIINKYQGDYSILQVGTGDSPSTIPFYEKCGFTRSHIIKNFFTDNYDHPIYDGGVKLTDMIYLRKNI